MNCRFMRGIGVSVLALLAATNLAAQENPAKRLASIVGVAVEEYAKAVDENGKLISKDEYDETAGFLSDARQVATRLNSYTAATAQSVLDSLIAVVRDRRPPSKARELHRLFTAALGTAGAMDMPKVPMDSAQGHRLFAGNCASCHGMAGGRDRPPPPSPITSPPARCRGKQKPRGTPPPSFHHLAGRGPGPALPRFSPGLTPPRRGGTTHF